MMILFQTARNLIPALAVRWSPEMQDMIQGIIKKMREFLWTQWTHQILPIQGKD